MSFSPKNLLILCCLTLWCCSSSGPEDPNIQCVGKCDGTNVDTDGDGLNDELELLYGLDPTSIDTDQDGVADGFEPIEQDSDCDGLIEPLDPDFGPATDCDLYPGIGVGNLVYLGDSYDKVRGVFLEEGVAQEIESSRLFLEGRLQITFGDLNLNGVVDPEDPVVAISALKGFSGRTMNGLRTGLSRDAVAELSHSVDLTPEHTMILPDFPPVGGGEAFLYYTRGFGLLFGYDGLITSITLHQDYGDIPDGVIEPEYGSVDFSGTRFQCGDGREGGDDGARQEDYQSLFGYPDFTAKFSVKVPLATVHLELDFYTFLGMTFVRVVEIKKGLLGTEHPQELVMILFSPPYAGMTSSGISLGAPKSTVESSHALKFDKIEEQLGFLIYKYDIPGGRPFGVLYGNDGQSDSDEALVFFLNMAF